MSDHDTLAACFFMLAYLVGANIGGLIAKWFR